MLRIAVETVSVGLFRVEKGSAEHPAQAESQWQTQVLLLVEIILHSS